MPKSKKAKYLDNRDLALRTMAPGGFKKVKAEIGDRLTPVRAARIVELLETEYDIKNIDPELKALAGQKRPGHIGGPVKPPKSGEEREYVVGASGRIGIPVGILGKEHGDTACVRYTDKQITIKGI